ncbi:hypothetical protein HPB51_005030 [Rhipicephalus microplus]|uniref:Uncharacterized protein n=1 Tax=Rhipicephalus microplus TaxID=6941 RepID=A0A9J6EX16_RHIMP|nr:hypothetical protein HPB51_005030 [Rhipicephalus microplus]
MPERLQRVVSKADAVAVSSQLKCSHPNEPKVEGRMIDRQKKEGRGESKHQSKLNVPDNVSDAATFVAVELAAKMGAGLGSSSGQTGPHAKRLREQPEDDAGCGPAQLAHLG